jgi:hypothetical protein
MCRVPRSVLYRAGPWQLPFRSQPSLTRHWPGWARRGMVWSQDTLQ